MSVSYESVWQELVDAAVATVTQGDCSLKDLVKFLEKVKPSCTAAGCIRDKALEFYEEYHHQEHTVQLRHPQQVGEVPYDATVRPIEETLAELARRVPKKDWDKLPSDLTDNLDRFTAKGKEAK